jgi:hypothetical protein
VNKSRILFKVVVGLFVVSTQVTPLKAQTISLAWDASPSPGIASYIVRYGTASGVYSVATNVGNQTAATVSGLQAGQTYYLAVTARDAAGIESQPSNEASHQVPTTPTIPPQITLNAPSANASFQSPATINCAASVIANGHTITKVQFYNGSTLLGEDVSSPYSLAWSGVAAGSYTVTAQLVYDSGSTLTSGAAGVVVTNPLPIIALSAPASGASYVAPATVNLAASVTANGHTITKVQFYNGSALLGEDASAPYGFAWTNVSAGAYALKARAVYDSGKTVDSVSASITVNGLPAPWQTMDIGVVGLPGGGSQSNGVYSVRGAGQIAGTADSFRFVYQTLSADGEIKAQLSSVQSTNTGGSFGVMIRENLTAGSRYAYLGVAQNLAFRWQRRSNTGGSTSATTSTVSTLPNTWVRLVRSGSTITGYQSTNGTTWTKVSSRRISMAANVYVGFVVASGSTTALSTATFTSGMVVP